MQPGYQPDTVVIGESTPQMGQTTASPFGVTGVVMGVRPMQMMSFPDAVMSCLKGTLSFEGRASRSEFWWFYLAFILIDFAMSFIAGFIWALTDNDAFLLISWLSLLLYPAILSAGVRRIHDHGKSGWFILVPFYNLYLYIAEGEAMPNAYGPVPTNKLD